MNQLAALNRAGHERLVKRRDEPDYMNVYQTVDHCNLIEIGTNSMYVSYVY